MSFEFTGMMLAQATELPTNAGVRSTVIAGSDPAVLSILAVADGLKASRLVRVRMGAIGDLDESSTSTRSNHGVADYHNTAQ